MGQFTNYFNTCLERSRRDLEGTILEQNDLAPANTSAQGPGSLKRQFAHDPLRRLISATGRESSNVYQQPSWDLNVRPQDYTNTNDYIRTYSYDKLGNVQELDHKATGHSNQDFVRNYDYSGDFNNNQLKQFTYGGNTYGYQYDPNGNITKEGTTRNYFWNAGDKLAAYSNQVGTSDPTVYTWYFYNAAGERVKKLVKKGQQLEVTFYCDGGIFETSYVKPTGGSIDNNRFYNTLHVLDGSSRISTIRVGTDADDSTPAIKYYLEDHLMDSLVVLKSDGSLINREEFYPFGETSFGGYGKKRYRFNGKEKDEESGLYNYGQRYYAPWLCRFVSVDPIAEDYPQLNSYNYAGNKPISAMDIEGLAGEQESVKSDGNSSSTRTLEYRNGEDSGEIVNIPAHGTGDNLSESMVDLVGNDGDPKKKEAAGDNWTIDENGNVHLVPGSGASIMVNGKKFHEFDFTNNAEAAAKIITHYYDKHFSQNKYHLGNGSVSIYAWHFENLRDRKNDFNVDKEFEAFKKPGRAFAQPGSANTDGRNRIYFHMLDGKLKSFENKYDIISTLAHERVHLHQGAVAGNATIELEAYNVQINEHWSWDKTSEGFKTKMIENVRTEIISYSNIFNSGDYGSVDRKQALRSYNHYKIIFKSVLK